MSIRSKYSLTDAPLENPQNSSYRPIPAPSQRLPTTDQSPLRQKSSSITKCLPIWLPLMPQPAPHFLLKHCRQQNPNRCGVPGLVEGI